MNIPEKAHQLIKELCAEGDVFVEMKEYGDAYNNYIEALNLVPEPKKAYEATLWIVVALGDMYFQAKDYPQAQRSFKNAIGCDGAIGNPFIHLRLGQIALELGEADAAADELCRAYMGVGKEIFEEDDPKYFAYLKTKMLPPADGVW